MLASLQRIRRLFDQPAHAYRPTADTFPDLDVQLLEQELELEGRGLSRGESNTPIADDSAFDAVENEIFEQIGAAQKRAYDSLENHLTGFRQRLIDLDFEVLFSDVKAVSAGGLSDLKEELQTGIDGLHGLRRDLSEAESWSKLFRKKNHLERPAKITTPRGTFLKWSLVVFLVFLELLVNGELLSKNNTLGLVGGIIEAVIFAILNVGVALLMAVFVVPYVNHRNWIKKFFGLIGLSFYVAGTIGLNLALAHYREVSGAIIDPEVGDQILQRLTNAPLALEEFRSWLLFVLGVLFSIVAFIDGLNMRDTYPGFAGVDKALRTARDKYANERGMAIMNLGEVRRDYEEQLRDARSNLSRRRTDHDAIVAHRSRLVSLFDEYQNQLEKSANSLLRVYRDANMSARSDAPPKRFQEAFKLSRISVQISKEGEWKSTNLQTSIRKAQTELDKLLKNLGEQFDDALAKYSELDVLVPDK